MIYKKHWFGIVRNLEVIHKSVYHILMKKQYQSLKKVDFWMKDVI